MNMTTVQPGQGHDKQIILKKVAGPPVWSAAFGVT